MTLNEIYEDIKKVGDGDNLVNARQNLFDYYKYNKEESQNVLAIIKKCLKDNVRNDMFSVFFRSDRQMYKEVSLLYIEHETNKCLNRFDDKQKEIWIDMTLMHANTLIENYMHLKAEKEIKDIFAETFKVKIPNFLELLDNYIQEKLNRHQEFMKSMGIDLENKEDSKKVVSSYSIEVDAIYNQEINEEVKEAEEFHILINEIIEDFNNYPDLFGDFEKIIQRQLIFNGSFLFKFDFSEEVSDDELNKLKADLTGQLSDGWGEGVSQKSILIGTEEISINFDWRTSNRFKKVNASNRKTI